MKLIGIMLTVIAIGLAFYWAYGRKSDGSTEGASDVAVARDRTAHGVCVARCGTEARNCSSVATEGPATEACAQAKAACEAQCPADVR